jgi:hypothetical protein
LKTSSIIPLSGKNESTLLSYISASSQHSLLSLQHRIIGFIYIYIYIYWYWLFLGFKTVQAKLKRSAAILSGSQETLDQQLLSKSKKPHFGTIGGLQFTNDNNS